MPKTKTTKANPSTKLYRSIHKLPLHIFIDCLVAKEYEKLILEGNPSLEELQAQFEALYLEYVELIGGQATVRKIEDTKRVMNMQTRIKMFELLIAALKANPCEELFVLLYSFHKYMPIQKDYSVENAVLVVNSMIPHYKSETIDLMNELDSIKLANPEGNKEQHYTYEYFTSILTEIESAFKLSIGEEISVGKFCVWVTKYKAYVKAINEQNSKIK